MPDEHAQNVPPPSSVEVTIRTMASDLIAMGHPGEISGLTTRVSTEAPLSEVAYPHRPDNEASRANIKARIEGGIVPGAKMKPVFWIIIATLGAALLFFLGFYVAPKIFG